MSIFCIISLVILIVVIITLLIHSKSLKKDILNKSLEIDLLRKIMLRKDDAGGKNIKRFSIL